MHSLRVVLLMLGVVTVHHQTNALKCYECSSRTPDDTVNCREPFVSTNISQQTCKSAAIGIPEPRCFTNENYNPGKRMIVRNHSTTARVLMRGRYLQGETKPRCDVRFLNSMLDIFETKMTISVRVTIIIY